MKTLALAILALEANPAVYASDGTLNYMPIFKIIIAVYLLYVAVLGRGKILENKHLKIEEKKFRTIMRAVALAGAVFGYANLQHILPGQDDAALREDARQMVRRALS